MKYDEMKSKFNSKNFAAERYKRPIETLVSGTQRKYEFLQQRSDVTSKQSTNNDFGPKTLAY